MVREAAKEAALDVLGRYSAEVDLKLVRSEHHLIQKVEESIDRSFEKFMGMTPTQHAIEHAEARKAVLLIDEIRTEGRKWFFRAIMAGAVMTGAVGVGPEIINSIESGTPPAIREERYAPDKKLQPE